MKDPTWWQWALLFAIYGGIYLMIGIGKGWLMRAIQMTIFLAVIGSNIQWHWTPSPYLPGLLGLGLAWLLTVFPVMLREWPIFEKPRHPPNTQVDLSQHQALPRSKPEEH